MRFVRKYFDALFRINVHHRCYRIGQRNNVTVYRFITAGSVEEHMYARQVQKDGLRRTLMTSGSATERHFTKDDLKRLFVLSPKGQCEMLDKINNGATSGVRGSSGLRSVLEKHNEVIGVSSHDMVYKNKIKNLVESELPPFAGTPLKTLSFRPDPKRSISQRHISFGDVVRDALPLQQSRENKNKQEQTVNDDYCSREGKNIISAKSFRTELGIKPDNSSVKLANIDEEFKNVETLVENGKIVESMDALLLMLEIPNGALRGASKLRVHQRIAALALYFGWDRPAKA